MQSLDYLLTVLGQLSGYLLTKQKHLKMTKLRAPCFVEWLCIYLLYIHSGPLIPLKFTDVLGLAWCSGRALLSFRVVKFRHYPFFPEHLTTFYVHIFPSFSGLQWRLLKPLQLFIQLDFPFFFSFCPVSCLLKLTSPLVLIS